MEGVALIYRKTLQPLKPSLDRAGEKSHLIPNTHDSRQQKPVFNSPHTSLAWKLCHLIEFFKILRELHNLKFYA
jgi:hypothetical protein